MLFSANINLPVFDQDSRRNRQTDRVTDRITIVTPRYAL